MQAEVIDSLHRTLDAEKAAILDADYDALGPIEITKKRLLEALSISSGQAGTLAEIKTKVETNQALLRAAINGLQAARARVTALQEVRDGLSVYDQSGRIENVANRRGGLEKKA
ncbi:MAG: flagellar protein FlgN [Yoonia sp.]|uniref:flagellar protein FlgN n=1 Tax=Yoonia sp. TaxID=2212373 RepID=UPI00273CFDC8|nr:flagellar protein FlgN [Yoonia sp.]MDP5083880.1 flagellar protein FlgN [Yoonia sp.]MDP5360628.1 flagellar protein FlgN [Paracoccaceae bacterium]